MRDSFVEDIKQVVGSYGLAPDLARVVFPFKLFIPGADMTLIDEGKMDELIRGLTEWKPASE